jgi:hypothetical protein
MDTKEELRLRCLGCGKRFRVTVHRGARKGPRPMIPVGICCPYCGERELELAPLRRSGTTGKLIIH